MQIKGFGRDASKSDGAFKGLLERIEKRFIPTIDLGLEVISATSIFTRSGTARALVSKVGKLHVMVAGAIRYA
jgi:hypothetical protein